jgi:hypothetical protein
MATSARSVVLVGDQMQLAQPIQGAHPRDSGLSGLEYLLEGQPVVPAERGIFLSKTWRMHPDLCSFVSAAVYAGQLQSEAGCATQRLLLGPDAHPALKPAGLSFVPVLHQGCRQKSEEEATRTLEILMSLLAQRVMDRRGRERAMSLDDVLVVAPYNMQVNLLRSRLPDGARVGTVDKFQGQEAEAVIVSMATSGAEDMPRDAAFLLSRNRFNVAISRARCLAVLVASPGLLDIVARSVDEMRLANLFCWAEEYAAQGQCTRWTSPLGSGGMGSERHADGSVCCRPEPSAAVVTLLSRCWWLGVSRYAGQKAKQRYRLIQMVLWRWCHCIGDEEMYSGKRVIAPDRPGFALDHKEPLKSARVKHWHEVGPPFVYIPCGNY